MQTIRANLNKVITAIVSIPKSISTDTFPYTVIKVSDASSFASGNMTFVSGIIWKTTFTPTSNDTYLFRVPHLTIANVTYGANYLVEAGATASPEEGPYYCTKEDLEGLGGEFSIPSGWSDDDIIELISDTGNIINDLINDDYSGVQELTYIVDGTGNGILFTRPYERMPIASITSIIWREQVGDSFTSVNEWSSSDFYANKYYIEATGEYSSIRYSNHKSFTRGIRNYQIIGNFGHASVPTAIKKACVLLCRETINAGYLNQLDMTSVMWSDFKYTVGSTKKNIPTLTGYPTVDMLLKKYVNKSIFLMKV